MRAYLHTAVKVLLSVSMMALLIQKNKEPEGNLVPRHIFLVGRDDEAIGYAGNLLAVLGTH